MNGKGRLGREGEDIALEYLERRGLKLLERNWRWARKEIDLVMESAEAVHVIEVKTLRDPSPIEPWEQVGGPKQANLILAAGHYIVQKHVEKEVQFDIVSIKMRGDGPEVTYIPKAFYPLKI